MLRPRIIPCLLLSNGGLVKTVRFSSPKYVGDPINAVRIFNEKEVDELIILDTDATIQKREPDYNLLKKLANECRMPLCYGGGVNRVEQVEKIISLGVEKVAMNTAAVTNPGLVKKAASRVGSQSIVVVMDVKKKGLFGSRYKVFTHNGSRGAEVDPVVFIRQVQELGAGEVVINSIDRDGEMIGYDFDLIAPLWQAINLPITVLGGAGSLQDIQKLIGKFGAIGAAAGSLFVFKGKYRAVLINYPNRTEKDKLITQALV
jgi:cyclase